MWHQTLDTKKFASRYSRTLEDVGYGWNAYSRFSCSSETVPNVISQCESPKTRPINLPISSSSSASMISAQQIEYTISERKPSGRPKITDVSTGLPRHISFSERFVSKYVRYKRTHNEFPPYTCEWKSLG